MEMTLTNHLGHPFKEFVMFELMHASYRTLVHLKLYDGTTNPQSHIDAFKNAMLIC